jgi:aspartyl-tRNA synthetase
MELKDFAPLVPLGDFQVFRTALENGGAVKALVAPGCGTYSRKQITDLEEVAKIYGAKGLAWAKVTETGLEGGISKFFEAGADKIKTALGAQAGDLLLFMADSWQTAATALGAVRLRLGKDLGLIEPGTFHFSWVIDFPLFEYNEEEKKWDPAHHMFSMPQERFLATMEDNPGEVIGDLYDLVCNGYELGSGSIRIHDPEIQSRIFKIVGFSEEEARERFGFLLNAFTYGAPPHGGIATGFDRMVMIMAGEESIREVIPFPKNTLGASPMEDSPAFVDQAQLKELHLKLDLPKKE